MEAQNCSQVRRLHIVYFLSRDGKIEHPHLIRVHHLSTNGVRLRDVKRWLGELRGMSMPDSFSWSYKRRYKTGYVWQDLVDEDLITPISDDEYVLKGSETCSSTTFNDKNFTKTTINDQFLQVDSKTTASNEENHHSDIVSTKSKQESESSTVTEESDKMEKCLTHRNKYEKKNDKKDGYFSFSNRKSNKATHSSDDSNISPSEPQLSSKKSKSNILHKFITCGPLDTNASAVNKQKHGKNNEPNFLNMCLSDLRNMVRASAEICKGDQLTTPKSTQQRLLSCQSFDRAKDSLKSKNELRKQRTPSAALLQVNVPNCSQCGKPLISGHRNEI